MKNFGLKLCILLGTMWCASSAADETLFIKLANNTPLFEDFGCHIYKGKEAIRAALQLIVSARIRLEIHAYAFDSPVVNDLLLKRSSAGVSMTTYSQSGRFPANARTSSMRLIAVGGTDAAGPLIVRSDNSFIGIGNIDLAEPLKVRSTFMVCHSNETADLMGKRFMERIKNAGEIPGPVSSAQR